MSDNAYINDLEERNAELRRELAEAKEQIERERKPWTYKLVTPPTPEGAARECYPDLSEDYELGIRDTGHSDRILLLSAPDLDERIKDLQSQLTAANATIAACKAAGFIDAEGRVVERPIAGTTADGVPVRVGQPVYRKAPTHIEIGYAQAAGDVGGTRMWAASTEMYYSTPAAAKEAQ